jgi:ribose/xylose/arabinose/galactoside ABC-type transport system permease subunit
MTVGPSSAAPLRLVAGFGARVGGLAIGVILVAIAFSLVNPHFLTAQNVLGILRNMSTVALMALGLTLLIVAGEIDISFAYVYGFVANLVAAAWVLWGWPVYLALLLGFGAAVAIGSVNAFLTLVVRIPSFIVTLGTGTLIYGLTLAVGQSASISPSYPPPGKSVDQGELAFFDMLAAQLPFGASAQVLWMIAFGIGFYVLLHRTLFGFRLMAIGGNPEASRIVRIPVRRYRAACFVICSVMAAVAALLDFSFVSSVQPNSGQGFLFPVFTAVIIGGTSLAGGRGSVIGTLTGSLLLAMLTIGLALIAAGSFVQLVVLGSITIIAVGLDQLTNRMR